MYHQPIFTFLGNPVNLYGIFIAIGILVCLGVFYLYTKKKGVPALIQDFVFYVAVASIAVGFFFAKLFQAFYNFIDTGVFDFASAGITVMGGIIGGAAMFLILYFGVGKLIYNKGTNKDLHKKWFNEILLVAPICIVIAHAFGRIGCLFGGCCYGTKLGSEYVLGGIRMCIIRTPHETCVWNYYVPTQLYEALFLFALFAVLSILFFKRSNIIMPIYLIAYGIWRFFIEFLRDDPRAVSSALSPSQYQSFIFIGIAIVLLVFYVIRKIPFRLPPEKDDK